MAVGPFEPVASCVTGWAGVASFLCCGNKSPGVAREATTLGSRPREVLRAMAARVDGTIGRVEGVEKPEFLIRAR